MRHVINQIQDLLEGLENLRVQQKELLACTESKEVDALPPPDLKTYQRLQREREAKGKFLAQMTGTKDDLKILLGQLSRLANAREKLLKRNEVINPMDLPLGDLTDFMKLWEMSDFVAGIICETLNSETC